MTIQIQDARDQLRAGDAGHGHVKQDEIEMIAAQGIKDLNAVGRLSGDDDVRRQGKKLLQTFTHQRVVIAQQDSNHEAELSVRLRGMRIWTSVPRPGALMNDASPPIIRVRSRMPTSPKELLRMRSASKP